MVGSCVIAMTATHFAQPQVASSCLIFVAIIIHEPFRDVSALR